MGEAQAVAGLVQLQKDPGQRLGGAQSGERIGVQGATGGEQWPRSGKVLWHTGDVASHLIFFIQKREDGPEYCGRLDRGKGVGPV